MALWYVSLAAVVTVGHCSSWPSCMQGFDLMGGDLTGGHLPAATAADCQELCTTRANCSAYSYHAPAPCSDHGEECPFDEGCCRLKNLGDMVPTGERGMLPNNNKCSCSALIRIPAGAEPLPAAPDEEAKNVLYLLFDDLRPELPGAYGHDFVKAPNFKKLSETATVFTKAYCQIAVCSPSRMSFMTGRRPTTTRTFNFMDHFRQADCGVNKPNTAVVTSSSVVKLVANKSNSMHSGGSGQCCTDCTYNPACSHWTLELNQCLMYSVKGIVGHKATAGAISGVSGTLSDSASWTSLPEAFKRSGWLTMGTGKAFHTEEGGTGPTAVLQGTGMPPNQDPRSWTAGLSMSHVNEAAPMDDSAHTCAVKVGSSTCPVDAQADGTLNKNKTSPNDGEFEDKIIANDGILKLRLGAHVANSSGRPFFLTVGFRKPHLCFRFPAPFLDLYPQLAEVPIAKHTTLDPSIPPIAHNDNSYSNYGPGQSPWRPLEAAAAQRFRLYYAATISWVDSQLGRVLDELEALGLTDSTVVVMHSDHGWSLGEQGEWQKFSNFELGTRVPLVVRQPGVAAGISDTVVELVDVMPTLMDLANVPATALKGESLDGVSLRHLLSGSNTDTKRVGLSLYARCPNGNQPSKNPHDWWKENSCLFTDRTEYSFVGLSLRTGRWRYTEWLRWDGEAEEPQWNQTAAAVELYDHLGDDGTDFDAFENSNLIHNGSYANVVIDMAALLRSSYNKSKGKTSTV